MHVTELVAQILKVLAAGLLLVSFAMLCRTTHAATDHTLRLAGCTSICLNMPGGYAQACTRCITPPLSR